MYILIDSSEEKVAAFIEIISSKYPEKSDVENIEVNEGGELFSLSESQQLSKIATYGGKMLEKQDMMLQKQDTMIEKQGAAVHLLQEVKRDTSEINSTMSRMEADMRYVRFSLARIQAA